MHSFYVNKKAPGYGLGVVDLSKMFDRGPTAEELTAALHTIFSSPEYKPPLLPVVATEILALSQQPNASITAVVRTLEKDSLLAARLLRRVQSPMYGATDKPVQSLKEAVMRLGMRGVADLVLDVALSARIFRTPKYQSQMDQLRIHSTRVAHTARLICAYSAVPSEYAFLCGLLHDVGIAAILISLSEAKSKAINELDAVSIASAIRDAHEGASSTLARSWGLPVELARVIVHHHGLPANPTDDPLCAVLIAAEDFVSAHEKSQWSALRYDTSKEQHELSLRARRLLGLNARDPGTTKLEIELSKILPTIV